ncbi:MAG: tellurium resistance protein [Paracoccaceae bacterium]|nr:tellurium resistance protein [Paracoccaceae bacterium]
MSHFPPPPPLPPKVALFHRVPPAVFPPVFGLLGLGVAWRQAVGVFGLNGAAVEAALGAITLLFAYCAVAYGAKAVFRPGAVAEDLRTLPGRTGLSAMALAAMLQALVLSPYLPGVATGLLVLGVAGLLTIAVVVLKGRVAGTDPSGPPTPAMHLVFVGFIVAVAPGAALAVALPVLAWVVWYAALAALAVAFWTFGGLLRGTAPPPLRPLQTIHLAPPALISSGALLTGQPFLSGVALAVACAIAAILLVRLRWMIEAGFSGFWSAFTFPVAAFVGALLSYANWDPARVAGGLLLIAASLYVPVIAYKVLKLWATGMLAAKTNASIA